MSLTSFHVFFISVCLVFLVGLGGWGVRDYLATHERGSIYLGLGAVVGAMVLVVYGVWFLRKIRRLKVV